MEDIVLFWCHVFFQGRWGTRDLYVVDFCLFKVFGTLKEIPIGNNTTFLFAFVLSYIFSSDGIICLV